jgi:hypothetical protein
MDLLETNRVQSRSAAQTRGRRGTPTNVRPSRHIGRRLLMVAALIALLEFLFFQHYNSLLTGAGHHSHKVSEKIIHQEQTEAQLAELRVAALRKSYPLVVESPNHQYAAYAGSDNVLHMVNLKTNKSVFSSAFPNTVTYLRWLRNDEVFVGENAGNGQLVLETANLLSGGTRLIQTFAGLSPTANFVKITDSPYTNDTYVLIADSSSSVVYHYDTDGNLFQTHFGGLDIRNISVSQTGDILYFEDYAGGTFNVGYLTQSPHLNHWSVHLIQTNAGLIGCVGNTFYYADVNSQGLATSVFKYNLATAQSTFVANLKNPVVARDIDVSANGSIRALKGPAHYAILNNNTNA